MTPELVLSMAREAITTILIVSAPVLGIGLAVGLLVSISRPTQIRNQRWPLFPK